MLARLVHRKIIDHDPLSGWKPERMRKTSIAQDESETDAIDPIDGAIDPFTLDEMRKILEHCPPEHRNLFQFNFWTGLRISELIALRWQNVNGGMILIRSARVRRELKGPKTTQSLRRLTLLAPAAEALTAQRELTYGQSPWIFLNPDGGPWIDCNQLRKRAWIPAVKAAGVRYRYPYQMRHTFASTMLTAGENPNWVATVMGHCNLAMIHQRYAKYISENVTGAGAKAVAMW